MSTPFNWSMGELDCSYRTEFKDSFNKALEQIRKNEIELRQCRHVANLVSVNMTSTDVSTPEKFLAAQSTVVTDLMNHRDCLKAALDKARQVITDALCAAGAQQQHARNCEGYAWACRHFYLPATHPDRATAPKCNCWVGRAAEFLKQALAESAGIPPEACACGNPNCDENTGSQRDI